ncbi:CBS domain-containing protein [Pseudoalteromonas sp.]|uniref:CBS domain-containing protein n=1 Tax=Pseudoalteromonas sp. TaxID=53249 RepID=UPI003567A2B9
MSNFKALRIQNIAHGVLAHNIDNAPAIIDLASPAQTMINNFTNKTPLRAHPDTRVEQALNLLSLQYADFILVTNSSDTLIGIVSSADLQSSKIIIAAQRLGLPRTEVNLSHLMTPLTHLHGISLQSLNYACIGDVLQTMQQRGAMYLLVTAASGEICGLISARGIAKTLQIPLHIAPIANGFSEVLASIEHPH